MPDRSAMLKVYLENDELKSLTDLSKDELSKVNFSKDSNDPLIEAIKAMIFSYCRGDAPVTVLQRINTKIQDEFTRANK